MIPGRESAQAQANHAKGRAERRAEYGRQEEKFEDGLGSSESLRSVGESSHQPDRQNGFQCVAKGNTQRCSRASLRQNVDEKCSKKNSGPKSVAPQEQCRERNSARRPHCRGALVDHRQGQAKSAGVKINNSQADNSHDRIETPVHVSHVSLVLRPKLMGPAKFAMESQPGENS